MVVYCILFINFDFSYGVSPSFSRVCLPEQPSRKTFGALGTETEQQETRDKSQESRHSIDRHLERSSNSLPSNLVRRGSLSISRRALIYITPKTSACTGHTVTKGCASFPPLLLAHRQAKRLGPLSRNTPPPYPVASHHSSPINYPPSHCGSHLRSALRDTCPGPPEKSTAALLWFSTPPEPTPSSLPVPLPKPTVWP